MALKSSQKCQIIFNFKDNLYYQAEKKTEKEFEMCNWFMVLWLYILLVAEIHQMPNISVLYSKFFLFYIHILWSDWTL